MKYLLSIYTDESSWDSATPEQIKETMEAYFAFGREVEERGAYLAGEGLHLAVDDREEGLGDLHPVAVDVAALEAAGQGERPA